MKKWCELARGTVIYVGVGLMLHAGVLGSHFDPSDVRSWGVVLGGPAVALVLFFMFLS